MYVDFEQVNINWVNIFFCFLIKCRRLSLFLIPDRAVESQVLTVDQQNLRKHLFGDDVGVVNVDPVENIDVDATENSNVSQSVVDISDEGIVVLERNILTNTFHRQFFFLQFLKNVSLLPETWLVTEKQSYVFCRITSIAFIGIAPGSLYLI